MKSVHLLANSTFRASAMLALSWLMLMLAIPTRASGDDIDPTSRVARISYLQGSVSIQIANSDEWAQARINRPLTSGDQVWTDGGARAELQIGMATIHLDEDTQLGVMELSDNVLQVQLNQGVLNLTVRDLDNDDTVEIDTPNVSVTIPEPGDYRIEVSDTDDLTVVQVRHGSANVAGDRQQYSVRENEQLKLRGSDRLNAQFDDLDRMDDFDRWVAARNSRASNASAAQYVDANVIGYEDLDDYGYWRWEAAYGNVWYPSQIVSGWSPYRNGHWDWIAPWGWTWVDDAPWGFAPFHYGRWAEIHHHWCWVPGPREAHAVYAPALVAWVGAPGTSITVNITGSVGWIPLGPREVYRPYYAASTAYLARVNISNSLLNRDEYEREYRRPHDDVFINRGAASVVSAATFTSAVDVRRSLLPIDSRQLQPIDGVRNLRPNPPAVLGNVRAIAPPPQIVNREVMAQRRPAPFIPHPELPVSHRIAVGGTVHLIEPGSRPVVGGQRSEAGPDRDFVSPAPHDNTRDETQIDNPHFDNRGRGNDHSGNGQNQQNNMNGNQPREWHPNPLPENHQTTEPTTNQQHFNPPQQNQLQEPQRRRIGPWIHDEQQLRPDPQSQPQQSSPPPASPPPTSRAEAPRSSAPPSPPRQNNPPNNQHEDHDHANRPTDHKDIK